MQLDRLRGPGLLVLEGGDSLLQNHLALDAPVILHLFIQGSLEPGLQAIHLLDLLLELGLDLFGLLRVRGGHRSNGHLPHRRAGNLVDRASLREGLRRGTLLQSVMLCSELL